MCLSAYHISLSNVVWLCSTIWMTSLVKNSGTHSTGHDPVFEGDEVSTLAMLSLLPFLY